MRPVTYTQKQIVKAFAKCDMSTSRTARETLYSQKDIDYHLRMVKLKTGLNPRNFIDLVRLLVLLGEADIFGMEGTCDDD